ncbi:Aspartate_aminotransferase [Hexamita inflata]|uniref:Aspartate aminotransferase n=1 Tax=Hexamita inflata TaxID=28002 RepID=A0AA86UUP1_9EUKA|nr:Aspartate aminotransferase [Hexamita inflata]
MSAFAHVPASKPDAILHLNTLFAQDQSPNKVSLGVGAYRDENGKPWILPSVKAAEAVISADLTKYNKEYPPQPGYPLFLKSCQEFLLGEDHTAIAEKRVASCQSLSGTGSLHVGMCFLMNNYAGHQFYMPSVTWPNHYGIFEKAYGKQSKYLEYTYLFKDGQLKIDFESMKKDMNNAPNESIFLLHACAHNPSGIDLSKDQWMEVLAIFKAKKHVAFFDVAYQGFATGSFEEDGFATRLFAREGVEIVVAQSFAKNFGLYGERVGCCHIVHTDKNNAQLTLNLQGYMCLIVRQTWSMSPVHGAYIVQTIGQDPQLKKQFLVDVQTMSSRIKKMRQMLYDELMRIGTKGDWTHILTCIGMFTFTGLTPAQVEHMKVKHAVYLVTQGGRMSMCGLTEKNVAYVAAAMKETVENVK